MALTLGPVVVGFPFAVVQLQQLPGGSDAVWSIALSGVSAFVWVAIGVLLFWRKSDNWMALLVALMLVVQGADSLSGVVSVSTEAGQVAAHVLDFLAFLLLFLVFCLFPNGRFVPHWIGWLVFGFLPVLLLSTFPILPFQQLWMLVWYGFLGGGVLAQLYRYRWGSSPMQRQQTKWVVLGVGVVFSVEFGLFLSFSASLAPGSALQHRTCSHTLVLLPGYPALPAVGHRCAHQPGPGLWPAHGPTDPGLLQQCHAAAIPLAWAHRAGVAGPVGRGRIDLGHSRPVPAGAAAHPAEH